ncbi:glycosyltransferase family 2 protein [Conidiobolus coronatus NRRL 28638]|uniref:chitin synthase n=1 Tax=Conidiobolus coronatus (strain ATCC 28846 / CBS 209.66 / NRRL 28638) TaxID=796925 RepID=A0A137P5V5_CONC2|nr:glycosyltransferase family 2 protein [Conidiobolus coronatus NRRL 28638]|eukprot:KXN70376.1 glycosyltransferase family 2 protein [Conidiobolus coronatus NRRL 28638]
MSHQDDGDLTLLHELDEHSLTNYLVHRLNNSQPFTNLGSNGLVVVNPNRDLGLFTNEVSAHYSEVGYKSFESGHVNLQPHIYDIATKAYFLMRRLGTDQSIIFCGPGNSGKSFSYRECLIQLNKLAINPKKPPKVPDQLIHLLNVIESFSNCSASNNQKSSRMGLYQELQFSNRGRICGVKTIAYYFEKSRLTSVPPQESNFEIFYQFLQNATHEEKQAYYLHDNFSYLPNSASQRHASDQYNIQESLKAVNFKSKARAKINQLLASILHLGNLEFVSAGDGQEVYIKNHDTLELIADWLGVGPNELSGVFSSKTQFVGKELCTVLMDVQGASHQRDNFAVTLYSLLFTWIIEAINSRFCDDESTSNYISLLDQISFEPHKINSLDQFCRNFSNERIRDFTLNYLLSNDASFRAELIQDELQLPDTLITSFPSAALLLAGPEGETGMIQVIDRHCHKSPNRRGEDQLLNSLNKKFSNVPEYLQTNPTSHSFTIAHYETNIEYHLYQFIDNNMDTISAEFVKLFQKDSEGYTHCSNSFLVELFQSEAFLKRYEPVTRSVGLDSSRDRKSQIDAFATISGLTAGSDYVLGNNKVFFSFPKWKDLEDSLRTAVRDEKTQGNDQSYFGFPRGDDNDSIYSGYDGGNRDLFNQSQFGGDSSIMYDGQDLGRGNSRAVGAGYGNYGDNNDDDNASLYKVKQMQDQKNPVVEGLGNNKDLELKDMSPPAQAAKALPGNGAKKVETKPLTFARKSWVRMTWFLTWWIPSCCLSRCGKMTRPDIQMAWREKVAICLLIFLSWVVILFLNIGLGLIFCPPDVSYRVTELSGAKGTSAMAYMYGSSYNLVNLAKYAHGKPTVPSGVDADMMEPLQGMDITQLFPLSPQTYCPGLDAPDRFRLNYAVSPAYVDAGNDLSGVPQAVHNTDKYLGQVVSDDPLWYVNQALPYLKNLRTGTVVYPTQHLNNLRDWQWSIGVIDGKVYDLSVYYNMTQSQPKPTWMPSEVVDIFKPNAANTIKNADITQIWNDLKLNSTEQKNQVKTCLDNLFYVGKIDPSETLKCKVTDILLLVFSGIALSVAAVKFLAALQLSSKRDPQDYDKFVILQVPCYTESEESVRRTLESLATLQYGDKHKLIFVIADGMIIGSGNDLPTPRIVLNVLGVDPKLEPNSFAFKSLGEGSKQLNFGKVYTGLYEIEGHSVPYVVVVKVGSEKEVSRPGNRGKRDSQIILMQFLNRVHFDTAMNPLELEMYHQMKNVIGVDPKLYEFVLMVDADTEVLPDSLNRLVAVTARDSSVMGLCGETTLVNENQSITTMMQVYEYYISHHLAKAFESLFGSVTCLPGCFSMYRIKTVRNAPLIISNKIIELYSENEVDTLHKKNLLSLGEDRYLTTLMLQQFPNYKMKFTPDAQCRTVVPERFDILLSQRRRWINSTIHNLFELLWLKDMCGFCCFSMRFVVMLDLVGTIILPASVIYLVYIIVAWATKFQIINYWSILIMASIYILQALLFIIKQKWEHIGWMIFYLFAIPLYNFYIPIYSYWHFDDFSWGNTRVVVGDGKKQIITDDEVPFDPASVPLMTWAEHEQRQWESEAQYSRNQSALGFNQGQNGAGGFIYPNRGVDSPSRMGSPLPYNNYGPASRQNLLMPDPNQTYGSPQMMSPAGIRGSTYSQSFILPDASRAIPVSNFSPYPGAHSSIAVPTPQQSHYIPQGAPISGGQGGVPDETLAHEIRFILSSSDLSTITKKQVRSKLQDTFQMDLSHKKEFINATIDQILQG